MFSRRDVLAGAAAGAATVGLTAPMGAKAASTKADERFVRVSDGHFQLAGKPYRYVGTNMWYGAYLGCYEAGRARLRHELDTLARLGIDNIRILGASEHSPLKNSMRPAIHGVGQPTREDILAGLDYCLAEMAKRGQKAVIFLNNFWEWSGGMVTYLYWTNGGHYIDLGDPAHPWPEFADYSAQFYASKPAVALYKEYVASLVGRTNTVTHTPYKNDPTIMAWQLANEPRPGGSLEKNQFAPFYAWLADTATFIKKTDPNHLVSSGNEGLKGCLESTDCVVKANAAAGIDYLTFHVWPLNWGWIDAHDLGAKFESGLANTRDYIETHVKIAQRLGKPAVAEEFGFPRDGNAFAPTAPTTLRDRYFKLFFAMAEASAAQGGAFAGTNFWAWGGAGRAQHPDFHMVAGDTAYVGDPPQEPQGQNSVFDSDATTLALIEAHAKTLKA